MRYAGFVLGLCCFENTRSMSLLCIFEFVLYLDA